MILTPLKLIIAILEAMQESQISEIGNNTSRGQIC